MIRIVYAVAFMLGIAGIGMAVSSSIDAASARLQHDAPIDRYRRYCDAERLLLRDGMRDLHTNPDVGEQMHRLLAQSDWREVRMCMPDDVTDWRIGCEEHDRGCMQLEMFSAVVRMSTP